MRRLFWIALIGTLLTPALARAQSEEVVYFHTDAIGSVRMITNAAGVEIDRYDFLPFGERLPPVSPPPPDTRQFAGQERDAETGLDYFGARYYRSQSGRFTTVDPVLPIENALLNPQRWNRYSYGLNNPLRNIDPDGRDTIDLAIGFVQGIGKAAIGTVTGVIGLITNPSGLGQAIAADFRLLRYGVLNPGEVLDTYVSLATSGNDADQRTLGAAIGEGSMVAAMLLAPTAKGSASPAIGSPKVGSAGGPGAGKRFSQSTKDAARAESSNCVFCGVRTTEGRGPSQSNIDHAIPMSRGGNNSLPNAQNTCRTCNLRKSTMTTDEFLLRIQFF